MKRTLKSRVYTVTAGVLISCIGNGSMGWESFSHYPHKAGYGLPCAHLSLSFKPELYTTRGSAPSSQVTRATDARDSITYSRFNEMSYFALWCYSNPVGARVETSKPRVYKWIHTNRTLVSSLDVCSPTTFCQNFNNNDLSFVCVVKLNIYSKRKFQARVQSRWSFTSSQQFFFLQVTRIDILKDIKLPKRNI